tara:strand:- start:10716 stop:12902 length:2187 start_codon:yes stop_codon:yes gene_type:complete
MLTKSLPEKLAGGVDQRWAPDANGANEIINMRLDERGYGWVADRGYEPLIVKGLGNTNATLALTNSIRRLFIWERHQGSEVYYLEKHDDGDIKYRVANTNELVSIFEQYHNVAFGRAVAKTDDPDEQFIPFGKFCAIINGQDQMLKFFGRDRVETFGFTQKTPALQIVGVDTDYYKSPPGVKSETDKISIAFDKDISAGVGTSATNDVNAFRYKVSFISNTGSESPMSDGIATGWTNLDTVLTHGIFLSDIPLGPAGTMKRRIYRTKNLSDYKGAGEVTYYLLTEIAENVSKNYCDVIPDSLLIDPAPSLTASSVLSGTYKYGEAWNGRMWLAGGSGTDTRIVYSERGLPEQFPTFNYFEVGNTEGGAITNIVAYYDNLIVFRDKSIDIIRSRGDGDVYSISTLESNIGTTATNAITFVPGYGVIFLSYDGVYLLSGGTLGGSSIKIQRISDKINREISRISTNSLAKATASYSPKEKEWWCMYPVDGQTQCSRGVVFHTLSQAWSFRNSFEESPNAFKFNDIATNPSGWFILAPEVTRTYTLNNFIAYNYGLHVWSAGNSYGNRGAFVLADQNNYAWNEFEEPRGQASWESAWEDYGDDTIKTRTLSVEVRMLSYGNNEIELEYAEDWKDSYTSAGTAPITVAEYFATTAEDVLLGPTTAKEDKSKAVLDTAPWAQQRVVRVRWDVNTGLVSHFKFRLKGSSSFQIVSYQLCYNPGGRKSLNSKAGS